MKVKIAFVWCHYAIRSMFHLNHVILPVTNECQIDGLVQDCSNSRILAMELPQSCTKPVKCYTDLVCIGSNHLTCFIIYDRIISEGTWTSHRILNCSIFPTYLFNPLELDLCSLKSAILNNLKISTPSGWFACRSLHFIAANISFPCCQAVYEAIKYSYLYPDRLVIPTFICDPEINVLSKPWLLLL